MSMRATSVLALVALLLLLASCMREPAAALARPVTDALGRRVALPVKITRVVTLAPNLTEMVFAIGAGGKVVGRDDASDYPRAARRVVAVGSMQPNVEKIAGLHPDLVLASTEGNHPSLAPALASAGIPLYVVRTDRLGEIAPAMRLLGELLEAPGAETAARVLERAIEDERRVRPVPPRLLFAVWTDPLYVAGQETFTDDLFMLAGARNAVERTGWPQYPLERIVASPPDALLYPRGAVTPQKAAELMARLPGVRARLVPVDEDIFQRPGPRVAAAAHALNAVLDSFGAPPR